MEMINYDRTAYSASKRQLLETVLKTGDVFTIQNINHLLCKTFRGVRLYFVLVAVDDFVKEIYIHDQNEHEYWGSKFHTTGTVIEEFLKYEGIKQGIDALIGKRIRVSNVKKLPIEYERDGIKYKYKKYVYTLDFC